MKKRLKNGKFFFSNKHLNAIWKHFKIAAGKNGANSDSLWPIDKYLEVRDTVVKWINAYRTVFEQKFACSAVAGRQKQPIIERLRQWLQNTHIATIVTAKKKRKFYFLLLYFDQQQATTTTALLIHSLTHLLTHSITLVHSYTRPLIEIQLNNYWPLKYIWSLPKNLYKI